MASACVGHRERSLRPGDCDFLRPVVVTDLATSFSTELIGKYPFFFWRGGGMGGGTFLIVQLVKNPPALQETPVRFLGWEDPLEKG